MMYKHVHYGIFLTHTHPHTHTHTLSPAATCTPLHAAPYKDVNPRPALCGSQGLTAGPRVRPLVPQEEGLHLHFKQ